uniref:RING-type domain-containing protein n=1 Tax=Macrostomum lignano TaxID=282301 RepID=A0A1I8FCC5_9PLAT
MQFTFVVIDECGAKGRTNVELRESDSSWPNHVSQNMTAFSTKRPRQQQQRRSNSNSNSMRLRQPQAQRPCRRPNRPPAADAHVLLDAPSRPRRAESELSEGAEDSVFSELGSVGTSAGHPVRHSSMGSGRGGGRPARPISRHAPLRPIARPNADSPRRRIGQAGVAAVRLLPSPAAATRPPPPRVYRGPRWRSAVAGRPPPLEAPELRHEALADAVEAVGLYFWPAGQRRCFDVAKSWLAYLEHLERRRSRFLVTSDRSSNRCHGNKQCRLGDSGRKQSAGASASGFELIELADERATGSGRLETPTGKMKTRDRCGLERMRQALHSHPWPKSGHAAGQRAPGVRVMRPNSAEPEADAEASAEANLDKDEIAIVEPEAAAAAVASAISANRHLNSPPAAIVDDALSAAIGSTTTMRTAPAGVAVHPGDGAPRRRRTSLPVHSAESASWRPTSSPDSGGELGMPEGELDGLEDSDEDD